MRLLAEILTFFYATVALAAFPALTGRVVDNAHLLSADVAAALENNLAQYEQQSRGNQLVVVTVPSLGGVPIEQYGYQLGRAWGIGQKGKNNGVLLIVAPTEHKVRIEVGYGLEGVLTDAQSNRIIQSAILPQFRQGAFAQGIVAGVQNIEQVTSGEAAPMENTGVVSLVTHKVTNGNGGWILFAIALIFFSQVVLFGLYVVGSIIAFFLSLLGFDALKRWLARQKASILPADRAFFLWLLMPSGRVTGYGGGSFGGFSGGGGSFGGGGSSGSW